jgi:hypothetical protein
VAAWLLGIGAPLLAAVIWGAVVAPKARWRLPRPVRVVVELGLFGVGQAPGGRPAAGARAGPRRRRAGHLAAEHGAERRSRADAPPPR